MITCNCPLCNSNKTTVVESVSVGDLNGLYAKSFAISDALKSNRLDYMECNNCTLKFFLPMETGDEYLYEQLQTHDWYYMSDKQEYQIALPFLESVESVLEVGSGKAAFATIVGVDRYTGLEFNDSAIERASKVGINLIKESIEAHAEKGGKYDAVVSFQVLEHVSSPHSFIKACVDCLKPSGVLVLAVPSRDGFGGQVINNVLDMPPHHVSHWSESSFRYLEKLFNVETIAIEHEWISSYHRQLAYKTQVETLMRRFLGLNYKLIDQRLISKLVSKLASIFAAIFNRQSNYNKGHTVVGIFRKI